MSGKPVELTAQIIGEIEGLKALVGAAVGTIALLAGPHSNFLEAMHATAHDRVGKLKLVVPDLDENAVKSRAEHTIDNLFGTLKVEFAKKQ